MRKKIKKSQKPETKLVGLDEVAKILYERHGLGLFILKPNQPPTYLTSLVIDIAIKKGFPDNLDFDPQKYFFAIRSFQPNGSADQLIDILDSESPDKPEIECPLHLTVMDIANTVIVNPLD